MKISRLTITLLSGDPAHTRVAGTQLWGFELAALLSSIQALNPPRAIPRFYLPRRLAADILALRKLARLYTSMNKGPLSHRANIFPNTRTLGLI
jgi:hypothetical protein